MKIIRDKLKIANNNKDQSPIDPIINKRRQLSGRHENERSKSQGSYPSTKQTLPLTKVLVENKSQDVSTQSNN